MIDLRPYEKLHTIQMLKEVVRKWWRAELALADARGYVLEHAEGRIIPPNNDFCRIALNSKEGFHRCNESVKATRDQLRTSPPRATRRSVVHECHLGFDLIACPIHLDRELAGFLFVGGSVQQPLGAHAQQNLLRKIKEVAPGASLVDRDQALATIPHLTAGEVDQVCDLIEFGADEIQNYHAELKRREGTLQALEHQPTGRYRFENIVGNSRSMQQVFRLLDKIIESESTVLIQGESGTGKELVARAIHFNGPRAKKPFVVQNCSAFNDNLLESALFGHVKGSFTGAIKDKKGLFELADGGTFFLDEIGDMSAALQVKLLRVLQEGTFIPVGGTETLQVDVRVIAATHKDLQKMVEHGDFREDLYYRIHVIKLQIPPLRDRMEDLPMLTEHFMRKHARVRRSATRSKPPRLAPEALAAMKRYGWPGNIRELENEIERCLVLAGDVEELPEQLLSPRVREAAGSPNRASIRSQYDGAGSLKAAVEQLERDLIHQGLIRTHWNKSQLAKQLGISRSNLIMKVERYGLDQKLKAES